VTNAAVSLPAHSRTVTLPAAYSEDNTIRELTFSWPAQTLQPGKGIFSAKLTPSTDYPVKKLDINSGMGSDYKGILIAEFPIATNSFGGTGKIQFRIVPVIPDKRVAQADHRFMYGFSTSVTGKIWLNNNLGANFANVNHSAFNPIRNIGNTIDEDANSYGSLFQWGRDADGHELMNWTSGTTGTPVTNSTTTVKATSDLPGTAVFITPKVLPYDWRSDNNNSRWQGEASSTNPCPYGFRVPTEAELQEEINDYKITNETSNFASVHKFPMAGFRQYPDGGAVSSAIYGYYWTSSVSGPTTTRLFLSKSVVNFAQAHRGYGFSVRCIRN
jgi:uncharacterized protein (TIGR02145 family)